MFFQRIYDEGLAQASYYVSCPKSGVAAVVDPRRDVGIYVDLAATRNEEITAVLETHIHADFISGARELAVQSGATLYVSGHGSGELDYDKIQQKSQRLSDRDDMQIGNVRLRALHTPGHTPEHLSFLLFDAGEEEPYAVLSGDFLFVGDVGRPDLLKTIDESADSEEWAQKLFRALKSFSEQFSPSLLIWPGHGAGSACGKALGATPVSSLGYELATAWWHDFVERNDEAGFVDELLEGMPEVPSYYPQMKHLNRVGAEFLDRFHSPRHLSAFRFRELVKDDNTVVVDTRSRSEYLDGHIEGSIHLPAGEKIPSFAGWVLELDAPYLLVGRTETVDETARRLARVGLDRCKGYVPDLGAWDSVFAITERMDAQEAREAVIEDNAVILDVRSESEYADAHIPDAVHVHYGQLTDNLDKLDAERKQVVHCATGTRATIACSILERHGYQVALFAGGPNAWNEAGYNLAD